MAEAMKAELVMRLMSRKKYKELHDLLLGVSPWNVGRAVEENPPLELVKLVSAARSHLIFLAKFGEDKQHVSENGKHYFAYPKEFSRWLEQDAPGLTIEELRIMDERTASESIN